MRKVKGGEILSVGTQISMKAQKNIGVNSYEKFIYISICNTKIKRVKKTTQRYKFLNGNQFGKNHGEEGVNLLFLGG